MWRCPCGGSEDRNYVLPAGFRDDVSVALPLRGQRGSQLPVDGLPSPHRGRWRCPCGGSEDRNGDWLAIAVTCDGGAAPAGAARIATAR